RKHQPNQRHFRAGGAARNGPGEKPQRHGAETRGNDMNRRSFLASSAAGATAAASLSIARAAQTVPPIGETGVPDWHPERLPLGPIPNTRYPDQHIEAIDPKRFKG